MKVGIAAFILVLLAGGQSASALPPCSILFEVTTGDKCRASDGRICTILQDGHDGAELAARCGPPPRARKNTRRRTKKSRRR